MKVTEKSNVFYFFSCSHLFLWNVTLLKPVISSAVAGKFLALLNCLSVLAVSFYAADRNCCYSGVSIQLDNAFSIT